MISTQARAALHEVLLQAALRGERAKAESLLDGRANAMARRFDSEISIHRVPSASQNEDANERERSQQQRSTEIAR
jgi:hypothetical protein